jgi:hypothetical protein
MNTWCMAVGAGVLSLLGSALAPRSADAADASSAPPALTGNPTSTPAEAEIPFARRNIFDWVADGYKGIWVQAIGKQWYYGTFLSPCYDLPFREGVAFRFGPGGELDKWGAVIVPHYPECLFKSFTLSDGPPRAKKKTQSPPAPAPAPPRSPAPPSGAAS